MRYGDRTLAGVFLVFASAQFLLAMLIAEGSLPSYSVSADAISDLGVGPTAPLFNSSVILLGVFTLAGAYFFHRTHHLLWITVPLLLAGVGPVGVGIFPETIPGPHAAFALISFLFGGLAALASSFLTKPPLRYVSLVLGVTGLVALGLFLGGQYAGIGFGGMERMIAYPVLLWEVAFGAHLTAPTDYTAEVSAPKPPT